MAKKLIQQNLTAQQLAHYAELPCYINNGRIVKLANLNYMVLYEHSKGGIRQVVPVLHRLSSIDHVHGEWISKQPYYVDGFALNFIKKCATDLFNFHLFASEWNGTDCYADLQAMGYDIFGLIDKGFAIDADAHELRSEYDVNEFQEIFFQ